MPSQSPPDSRHNKRRSQRRLPAGNRPGSASHGAPITRENRSHMTNCRQVYPAGSLSVYKYTSCLSSGMQGASGPPAEHSTAFNAKKFLNVSVNIGGKRDLQVPNKPRISNALIEMRGFSYSESLISQGLSFFTFYRGLNPEAMSYLSRPARGNADEARSAPPARRSWTPPGNHQCPIPSLLWR